MSTKFNPSIVILSLSLVMIIVTGCTAATTPNPTSSTIINGVQGGPTQAGPEASTTQNYQMLPIISGRVADLILDAKADGTTQQLKMGEVMAIVLESNPSTGFSWFTSISNQNVLAQMGEPQYQEPAPANGTPMLGVPGTDTFFFQVSGAGTATLTLDYKQGFEANVAPEKTITINIEVK